MPAQDKPYRVYRGGRAKGRVPLTRDSTAGRARPGGGPPTPPGAKPRRRRRPGRWIVLGLVLLLVLLIAWGVTGYLSVAGGVTEAGERVPVGVRRQLTANDGLLVSSPTTILVLGTDGSVKGGREAANRSDSIMLIRTDPGKRRLSFLSIPRDLQVDIPDIGLAKINAANQVGGPALALRTVERLTGVDVNHVAFVDFDRFEELIDAVGGIDVVVPHPIRSNRFDCPYKTAKRCAEWPGWRFERGKQHMDGRRALVYSRVRHNLLDPSETDFSRARRQQQIVQATLDKVTSVGTALRLPFRGGDLVAPLATDLSAWQLMQLGWVYFRADTGRSLHCRLGGDPATVGGESVILGSEDNVATIAMFTGRSAPLPPPRGLPYAPGCLVGERQEARS
jgi:LCP family protein required for cell wall assembly